MISPKEMKVRRSDLTQRNEGMGRVISPKEMKVGKSDLTQRNEGREE